MSPNFRIFALSLGLLMLVRGDEYPQEIERRVIAEETVRGGYAPPREDEVLRVKIAAYRKDVAKMPPADAARGWLELFDELAGSASQKNKVFSEYPPQDRKVDELFEALPQTAAWEEMGIQIDRREKSPEKVVLVVLIRFLRGMPDDAAGRFAVVKEGFKEVFGTQAEPVKSLTDSLDSAFRKRAGRFDNGSSASHEVAFQQARLIENLETWEKNGLGGRLKVLHLPNLEGGDAEDLLSRAIKSGLPLQYDGSGQRRLVKELILKDPGLLKMPMWDLVEIPGDTELLEIMLKKFPARSMEDSVFSRQAALHLARMPGDGKKEEAKNWLSLFLNAPTILTGFKFTEAWEDDEKNLKTLHFLEELLVVCPDLDLWSDYLDLAATMDRRKESIVFLRETADLPGTSEELKKARINRLNRLILSSDLEAGTQGGEYLGSAILARMAELKNPPPRELPEEEQGLVADRLRAAGLEVDARNVDRMILRAYRQDDDERFMLGIKLAAIGGLMKRQEWINEGIAVALETSGGGDSDYRQSMLLAALMKNGRDAEAEVMLLKKLELLIPERKSRYYEVSRLEQSLFSIYQKQGRWAEIVSYLDHAPNWSGDPYVQGLKIRGGGQEVAIAAEALAAVGRMEEAGRLIDQGLESYPICDEFYQVMLKLENGEGKLFGKWTAVPDYPGLVRWVAEVHLRNSRLEEAEKIVRAELAAYPRHMGMHAMLAEVLRKKGDMDGAETFLKLVESKRLATEAAKWRQQGMGREAEALYLEALDLNPGDATIECELRDLHVSFRDLKKAAEHHERAIELLPDATGRFVSPPSTGFSYLQWPGQREQSLRVLEKSLERRPEHLPTMFLLGCLHIQMGNKAEGVRLLRRVVQADPDCGHAWMKLWLTTNAEDESARDDISVQMIRLRLLPSFHGMSWQMEKFWDAVVTIPSRPYGRLNDVDDPQMMLGPVRMGSLERPRDLRENMSGHPGILAIRNLAGALLDGRPAK